MDFKKDADLTNERKYKKFKSQFELVNFAINVARHMIRAGVDTDEFSDGENITHEILDDIEDNPDRLSQMIADGSKEATSPAEVTTFEAVQIEINDRSRSINERIKGKK
jgi:DNA-directed RNA polymerase subunit omega